MEARRHDDGARPRVERARAVERPGEVGDPPALADSPAGRDVELDELHGARGDQLAVAVEAVLGLVAADGDRPGGLDASLAGDVVRRDRRLEPVHVVGRQGAREPEALGHAEVVDGVHHEANVRAHRLPHGGDPADVLGERRAPDLQLDAREALGHVAGHLGGEVVRRLALPVEPRAGVAVDLLRVGAEEPEERDAQGLSLEVPQGGVDGGERRRDDPGAGGQLGGPERPLPDALDEEGVLSDHQRRQVLLDRGDQRPGRRRRVPRLADAELPGVGLEEHQDHHLFLPPRPRVPETPAHVSADDAGDDPDDLHDRQGRSPPGPLTSRPRRECRRMPAGEPSPMDPSFPIVKRPASPSCLPVLVSVPHHGTRPLPHITADDYRERGFETFAYGYADTFVGELYGDLHEHGATVLTTEFSRMFVDVNRRRDDFEHHAGEVRSRRGVVRTHTTRDAPIFARPLGLADLEARLRAVYDPYYASLDQLLAELRRVYGYAMLLDGHTGSPRRMKDHQVIIGTRHDTTCAPAVGA